MGINIKVILIRLGNEKKQEKKENDIVALLMICNWFPGGLITITIKYLWMYLKCNWLCHTLLLFWVSTQNFALLMYHNLFTQFPIPGQRVASNFS